MKKVSILVVLLTVCLSAIQIFAQKKTRAETVVIVEITVGEREEAHKTEISIRKGIKRTKQKQIKPAWSKDSDGTLPPQYNYDLEAYSEGKNSSRVYFQAVVEKCSETIRESFIVSENRSTELKLGCNVTLKAYYGLKSKDN